MLQKGKKKRVRKSESSNNDEVILPITHAVDERLRPVLGPQIRVVEGAGLAIVHNSVSIDFTGQRHPKKGVGVKSRHSHPT